MMLLKGLGQTLQPARRGIAADAGVDHAIRIALILQPLSQQADPAHPCIDAVSCAETVAQDQNVALRSHHGSRQASQAEQQRDGEQNLGESSFHGYQCSASSPTADCPVPVRIGTPEMSPHGKPAAVSARSLAKTITGPSGELVILKNVTLDVVDGESVAILGASGSGKSTLLGLLAGLDEPTSGEIVLAGQSLASMNEDGRARLRAGNVGFVFQSFQLLPGLSALENVMLPLELLGRPAQDAARDALARVGLSERLRHYPHQLSGGEQQRVAIARAFVARPAVLFADEPTGNLDENSGNQVTELLFSLNAEEGAALVLVTHDPALAARCNRRYSLVGGALQE